MTVVTSPLDLAAGAVRRIHYGYFVRPKTETGTESPRVEPVLGYVVRLHDAVLLLDTGMGSHPDVDAHYRPRRHSLRKALRDIGMEPSDVTHVTNCHLHFDHCGGNPELTSQPTFVQRTELSAARTTPDYTLPELLEGSRFVELDGETEVLPGIVLVPTPGHTDGHQSVVVRLPTGAWCWPDRATTRPRRTPRTRSRSRLDGTGIPRPCRPLRRGWPGFRSSTPEPWSSPTTTASGSPDRSRDRSGD